jgi:hypothetical protein
LGASTAQLCVESVGSIATGTTVVIPVASDSSTG